MSAPVKRRRHERRASQRMTDEREDLAVPVWSRNTWLSARLNSSTSPLLGPFLLGLERKTLLGRCVGTGLGCNPADG